ncbi:hypothetical protein LTR53_009089 [Teratosphaeriaceae sp. CCFEE 6253]|nr:hypothetical protein LTR53_009089 [Teratosphaeriaceae sp. CCFEE 6253]
MQILGGSDLPAGQNPESSLRLPAQKRISTANAARLSTITESSNPHIAGTTPSQPRGNLRPANLVPGSLARANPSRPTSRETARTSQDTTRTAPPAYTWVPEPLIEDDEDLQAPVEGEKLAELRRNGPTRHRRRTRGGWGRLIAIIALVLIAIIALAVGLGVGLSKKHHKDASSASSSSQPAGTTPSTSTTQQFPLGEYSLITALRKVVTNCTSNPSTWRCYPYSTYDAADGSNTSSLATFNWIIANTSTVYATSDTTTAIASGVPANLTISSTNNPFSIAFTDQSLTYLSNAGNGSSARYTFSFTESKSVIPSTSLLSSGAAAECFFNATTFTGTLYLNANSTFPGGSSADQTGFGGYTPWPYAVEISEVSGGGEDVPACYEMVNGGVGDRILTATTPEPEGQECLCDYRNF